MILDNENWVGSFLVEGGSDSRDAIRHLVASIRAAGPRTGSRAPTIPRDEIPNERCREGREKWDVEEVKRGMYRGRMTFDRNA